MEVTVLNPAILSEQVAVLATLEYQGCKLEIKKGDTFTVVPLVVRIIKKTENQFDGIDEFGFLCEVVYNFGESDVLESFRVDKKDICSHHQTTKPILLAARFIAKAAYARLKQEQEPKTTTAK